MKIALKLAVFCFVLVLSLVNGCRSVGDRSRPEPSLFFLSASPTRPAAIALGFSLPLAPFGVEVLKPDTSPEIEPAIEGIWRWRDEARLVFEASNPEQSFLPGKRYVIDFSRLAFRSGASQIGKKEIVLPELQLFVHGCSWDNFTLEPPLSRVFRGVIASNYPIYSGSLNQRVQIALKEGSPLEARFANDASGGVEFKTLKLALPAKDSVIEARLAPGEVQLYGLKGPFASFSSVGSCSSPFKRGDWLALEDGVKPVAESLRISWGDAPKENPFLTPLQVQIVGSQGDIGLRGPDKIEVSEGVSLQPPHRGTWSYDANFSLLFKPQDSIPPGTKFEVKVLSFPGVEFKQPISKSLRRDPPRINLESLELYHEPLNPRSKRVAATVRLSYPFERGSLEARTVVRIDNVPIPFDVVYDPKDASRAFIKSKEFELTGVSRNATLEIGLGIMAQAGGVGSEAAISEKLKIPSESEIFKVVEAVSSELNREDGSVERILSLRTAIEVDDSADLAAHLEILLLPECGSDEHTRLALCREKGISRWSVPEAVDSRVEQISQRLTAQWKSSDEPKRLNHIFSFTAPENREVLVKVRAGAKARGGYLLSKDSRFVLNLGMLQRELRIMNDGALLSLSGDKKLGLMSRGVKDIRIGLRRVTPENLHHFAALTTDKFKNPATFLDFDYFAEEFSYEESFPQKKELEALYTAVDFSKFLHPKGPPRGLFILTVRSRSDLAAPPDISKLDEREGLKVMERYKSSLKHVELCNSSATAWDPDNQETAEGDAESARSDVGAPPVCDQRLVLITDLGLLVKRSDNGEQDLFVMSFRAGEPVSQATVSLIGKNGVTLFSEVTDKQGHVRFPRVDNLINEKQPVVYLVTKDGDLSFIPFERGDRQLNLSRFDTGGIQNIEEFNSLQAYLFTDRGIYRPGDTVRLGALVRKKGWEQLPNGLPLELSIFDSRRKEVFKTPLSFDATGFMEISWPSSPSGATGSYRAELHLIGGAAKGESLSQIGGALFRVEEFQPDRLLVKTEVISAKGTAIVDQRAAVAKVSVRNLFGTEAVGNLTQAEISVRPWSGIMPQYPGYQFRRTTREDLPSASEKLGEQITGSDGSTTYKLGLESYNEPVLEFTVVGEGFEKGSGRSVVSIASTVATSLSSLVGFKADGDLNFISKGSVRTLDLIAVDNSARRVDAEGLQIEVLALTYQSTLVRQPNGLFAYQSVETAEPREKGDLTISNKGRSLKLNTREAGRFRLRITDKNQAELLSLQYSVTGEGNVTKSLERNAELTLTLNREEYEPGAEIAVNIVAPYTGAGLITVESDRVHTQRWFRTSTTSTTERIKLPDDLKGNAYLSVAFVRSFDSTEIFMSPLSYGVVPFKISKDKWRSQVRLQAPKEVVPGKELEVSLTVNEASRALVFAVDEGILQFARYRNPNPLDHFFRKRALQVSTYQILDLILPDYQMVQRVSSSGGDEDSGAGRYKNPFARKQKAPMAFWSGLSELPSGTHQIKIPVPSYFAGTIRVIAVVANSEKIGTAVQSVIAKGPFVIQPQQPYAIAPGDEFEVGAVIGNNSLSDELTVSLNAPEGLTVISENPLKRTLALGADTAVRFRVKATQRLGPASINYSVAGGGESFSDSEELSVRPASPFMVLNSQGRLSVDDQRLSKEAEFVLNRDLFEQFRSVQVSVSGTPFGLLTGLVRYLKGYPYGCTEQVVSQAFPALVLGGNDELGFSKSDAARFIDRALKTLIQRQRDDGSFGLWSLQGPADPFYSVYAVHFLVVARRSGYAIPANLYDESLRYLREYTDIRARDGIQAQAQSYALYVLSLVGESVGDKIRRLVGDEGVISSLWNRIFLAAAYRLNNLNGEAEALYGYFIAHWRDNKALPQVLADDPVLIGAFLYLTHKHFAEVIKDESFRSYLKELSQEMLKRRTNSFASSFALLGLGEYWGDFSVGSIGNFTLKAGHNAGPRDELALQGSSIKRAEVLGDANRFSLRGDGSLQLYYQVTEEGYDRDEAKTELEQGLKLSRRLLNGKGDVASVISIADSLRYEVTLNPSKPVNDLAVVIILPGGFEVDLTDSGLAQRRSLPVPGVAWQPEHVEVMEDRVVLFGDIGGEASSFAFKLKPVTKGVYKVPPLFAEGMYENEIVYRGISANIKVDD